MKSKNFYFLWLLVILSFLLGASAVSAQTGLVSWWPGEGNANDVVDGNHGTLINGATFGPCKVGQGFQLLGTTDYVRVNDNTNLNIVGDLTLSAWINLSDVIFGQPDALGVGGDRGIIDKRDDDDILGTYSFWIEGDAETGIGIGSAPFRYYIANPTPYWLDSDILTWMPNIWYHVAVVKSGNIIIFYRDGMAVGTGTLVGSPVATPGSRLAVGAIPSNTGIFNPIKGFIDEVKIYARALSATEIQDNFNSSDTSPPTINSTSPANGVTDVGVNSTITATFDESMDASTIDTTTFTVSDGTNNISGTVSYSGTTATFTPSSNLAYSTTYTAIITTGVKDLAGNAMSSNYTWSFTTIGLCGLSEAANIQDDFNDTALNENLWTNSDLYYDGTALTGNGGSAGVINGYLETTAEGGSRFSSGGIKSLFQLMGDFDIQVDFNLVTFNQYWSDAALLVSSPDGKDRMNIYVSVSNDNNKHYESVYYINNVLYTPQGYYIPELNDASLNTLTSGKLRLTRTGSTITSYYWTGSGWVSLVSATVFDGPAIVYLIASNDGNAGSAPSVNVQWDNFNASACVVSDTTSPTVSSTSPTNGATDVAINSTITATFSESMDASTIDTTTFTVSDGTSNISGTVSYSGTTATFTPSANLSYSTTYTATITTGVKDLAGNAIASDYAWSFTTGIAPNNAPIANAGSDQSAYVGNTVTLDGSGSSDPDGNPLTYSWSFISVPNGSMAALSNATSVNPSFTVDKAGTYEVSVTVSDGSLSSTDTVMISTINVAPVANAGADQSVYVGNTVTLDGSGSTDADGNSLTYSWSFTNTPSGSTATLSDTTIVNPTFTVDKAGTYVVSLMVNDGTVDSTPDTVSISTLNSAPVANAGPDQSAYVNNTVTLDGSGSTDVDGNLLTCKWAFTSKPEGSTAALSDVMAVNPTFTIDKAGTYVVSLIVNDGTVDSTPATVTISTLNSAPVASAGADQSAHVNDPVTLDGSGSTDVDSNQLTYKWAFTTKPADSTATLSDSTAVNPTFTVDKAGTYVVSLFVNDGTVNSETDTVTISTINVAPVASAGTDQSITVIGTTVLLDGLQSYDPDGDSITYQWSFISIPSGSNASLANGDTATPTFTADVHGDYIVQLVVNDASVQSSPDTVTISFENIKPVADAGSGQAVQVGETVTLDGSGSTDANGDTLTYQWTLTSVPSGSSSSIADSTAMTTTFVPDVSGTYVVQLVVNDGTVDSDPVTIQIQATTSQETVVDIILDVENQINLLDPSVFKNANMQNTFINKLNAVIANIEAGNYADALDQLQNDILGKMDGCATSGAPDKNDWIKNCDAQGSVYPYILRSIEMVEALM